MTRRTVESLKDSKGIYGVIMHREPTQNSIAEQHNRDLKIITRPDMAIEDQGIGAIYSFVPPKGLFRYSTEVQMINEFLQLRYGEPKDFDRKRWFGLKASSRMIVNKHIAESLAVADQDALKMVRRYPANHRQSLYRHACKNKRALQLMDTFPLLALYIYFIKDDLDDIRLMVAEGRQLKDIAAAADIPMALRRIKPGALGANGGHFDVMSKYPKLVDAYFPDTLHKQRIWIRAIRPFVEFRPDALEWAMRNGLEMSPVVMGTAQIAGDLSDWIRTSILNDLPDWTMKMTGSNSFHGLNGGDLITRPFNGNMDVESAISASNEWHEAVSMTQSGGKEIVFDAPWYNGGNMNGHEIIPLATSSELVQEGARMRHCIRTYIDSIKRGTLYPYTVKADGKHVATFTLHRGKDLPLIGDSRGFANSNTPPEALKAIKSWLKREQKSYGAGKCKPIPVVTPGPAIGPWDDDFDDDIPF